jgi:hypothetical protein
MFIVQFHHHLSQLEKFADILSRGKEYNITEITSPSNDLIEMATAFL